jgi:hypothetical protein
MNNIIEKFYEDYNFPGLEKLYKLISAKHKNISKADVKEFLGKQEEEQIFKPQPVIIPKKGSIVALSPNETWQMDLLDVSKYSSNNKNYNFILLVIDVFTRKAYGVAIKKKDISDITEGFLKIKNMAQATPQTISSDNESAFLSNDFQDVLEKEEIVLDPNVKNDHNALGVIDFFCKRLRLVISKNSVRTGTKYNWYDILDKFINNYNNTPNTALEDITPNEAHKPENSEIIFAINLSKSNNNKQVSDLEIGDTVRLRISTKYTKASEPQWSDEIYKVQKIRGSTIELDNDTKEKRVNLLKVVETSKKVTTNAYEELHKEKKAKVIQKREDIKPENIRTSTREHKKKEIIDLGELKIKGKK